ncbi:MAG TPA: Hpt domain-containing protein, partial [Myxococcaceae bacterium]|nr:Hpt domain-containing protein [Myxococcaceae bacterium]
MNESEELLAVFREEAADLLSGLTRTLVQLETAELGEDRTKKIREVFRLAHTLKGSAATAGRGDIAELAHALESALDAVRRGTLQPSKAVIDASLSAVDLLEKHLIDVLDPVRLLEVAAVLDSVRTGGA